MMPLQFGNNEDVFQPSASPLQLCKNEDVFQPSASPSPPTLPPSPVSVSTTAGAPSEPDLGSSRNKFIHECSHCPRSFTRRYNLLAHIRGTHSLEKPYTCALCPRAFTRKHDFDRHAVSCHWKVKPFQCPRCSRRFARSDALKKHGRRKQCKDPDSD
ncbi:hypothetical protein DFJ77DRAFT_451080 [Powellomyces hirtus]|nr:hypothetical protein DFJ77DRAFT_451080 [Powellomyces hirtus]